MIAEPRDQRMLRDHRRALAWSLLLLGLCIASLFVVGRHPSAAAPKTTLPFVGRFDASVNTWMDDIRTTSLTWISEALDRIGGGSVTIPLRIAAASILLLRRRWRHGIAFACTWAASEIAITSLKVWFHRGRPPGALVGVTGYSFPSGHAVAAAATAVALVLAFLPPGERRRRWELLAVTFVFVMACSRVYLSAHWFSDVVVGTLLGSGIAVLMAAAVTEMRDLWFRTRRVPIPLDGDEPPSHSQLAPTPHSVRSDSSSTDATSVDRSRNDKPPPSSNEGVTPASAAGDDR
jgi:membrane-associated phospholipid phosphatase